MIIDFAAWHWPQYVLFGAMAFVLSTGCFLHGHNRGNFNAGVSLLDFVIFFFLLWAGGFWS